MSTAITPIAAAAPPPAEPEIRIKTANWAGSAKLLKVEDDIDYDIAAAALLTVKELRAEVEETFGPIVKKAHEAHKEAVAQRKRIEEPMISAETELKAKMAGYAVKKEQQRLAEELRLRELAEQQHAELVESQLVEAERNGASAAEVQTLIAQAPPPRAVVLPSATPKVAGISTRESWSAHVTDMAKFIKHVAANPDLSNLLLPNEVALNAMARSLKLGMRLPGVEARKETGISARR